MIFRIIYQIFFIILFVAFLVGLWYVLSYTAFRSTDGEKDSNTTDTYHEVNYIGALFIASAGALFSLFQIRSIRSIAKSINALIRKHIEDTLNDPRLELEGPVPDKLTFSPCRDKFDYWLNISHVCNYDSRSHQYTRVCGCFKILYNYNNYNFRSDQAFAGVEHEAELQRVSSEP